MAKHSDNHGSTADICPACKTVDIDDSIDEFEAVCEICGFVIHKDNKSVALEWEVTDGTLGQSKDNDWISECQIRNSTEQQLAEAFETLEDIANQLELPDKIREDAVDIYCDTFRAGLTDGRKTACVVAACLRLASRRTGIPIPLSRLTKFTNVEKKKSHRCHLAMCDELGIESQMPKPQEYTSILQLELGLTEADLEAAEQLVNEVEERQAFVGKHPAGIAAGGVYLLHDCVTQQDVADAVGLSRETVRQRVQQLQEVADYV